MRHTLVGVTAGVTGGVTAGGVEIDDWLAHFDERAGIIEFDGGYDRAEAERRALRETIAALGPARFQGIKILPQIVANTDFSVD